MYKHTKWVSYDNEESIRLKSKFAYDHGLAGVMTWSIDTDDFRGVCGGPKYPLLRTINHALYQSEQGLSGGAGSSRSGGGLAALIASVIVSALIARL